MVYTFYLTRTIFLVFIYGIWLYVSYNKYVWLYVCMFVCMCVCVCMHIINSLYKLTTSSVNQFKCDSSSSRHHQCWRKREGYSYI